MRGAIAALFRQSMPSISIASCAGDQRPRCHLGRSFSGPDESPVIGLLLTCRGPIGRPKQILSLLSFRLGKATVAGERILLQCSLTIVATHPGPCACGNTPNPRELSRRPSRFIIASSPAQYFPRTAFGSLPSGQKRAALRLIRLPIIQSGERNRSCSTSGRMMASDDPFSNLTAAQFQMLVSLEAL